MSTRSTKWSFKDLEAALKDVQERKVPLRTAAVAHGVPKSTLYDYASGKVEFGSKRGPDTILTAAEEKKLVDYAIHMAEIGYGRTKEHICDAVKEILDKDGRPNPFKDNRPGRKWWSLFMKRHPNITLRSPEHLQLCRVRCSTSESLDEWFQDFDQFLQAHCLKDKPHLIWNADEAGFPLCPKTGKVIAIRNARNVYGITGDAKEQITTLCAANAAGDTIPPMHIFSGERFKSNPMDGCVDQAYFGRSPNGWISTELFYGWVANHFAKHVMQRPVVLLVDGHKTHIDLEVSKFCRDQQIHLYCLPPHTSHITQPLDVGFYGPLKTAWGKACEKYKLANPGIPLTKYTFARVFKVAWIDCVKVSTFVNAFKHSGICPLNRNAIDKAKILPSLPFSSKDDSSHPTVSPPQAEVLGVIENMLKPETLQLYNTRYEESYDIQDDELYVVWSKLKQLSITNEPECVSNPSSTDKEQNPLALLPEKHQKVSSVLEEVLTYPEPAKKKPSKQGTSCLPKHLTSEQVIAYLEDKKLQKEREEDEKQKRKEERERKKREREEEKKRKQLEREKKRVAALVTKTQGQKSGCARRGRGRGRGRGAGRGTRRRIEDFDPSSPSSSESESSEASLTNSKDECPVCGVPENGIDPWIACDSCNRWFHIYCTSVDPHCNLDELEWKCPDCM